MSANRPFEIGCELDPAKKHGQRHFTWPNEDTNGRLAKRFLKRKAAKEARRYIKRVDRKTDRLTRLRFTRHE